MKLPLLTVLLVLFLALLGCKAPDTSSGDQRGGQPLLVADAYFDAYAPVRGVGLPVSFDTLHIFSGHQVEIQQMKVAPNGIVYVWEEDGLTLEAHSFKGNYLQSITFAPDEFSGGGVPNHVKDVAAFSDGGLAVLVTSNVYRVDDRMTITDSLDNWKATRMTVIDSVGVCTFDAEVIRCLDDTLKEQQQISIGGTRGLFNWDLYRTPQALAGRRMILTYWFYPYLELVDLEAATSTLIDLPVDREMPALPERRERSFQERTMPAEGFPNQRIFGVLDAGIDLDQRIHVVINDPGAVGGSTVLVMTLSGEQVGTYQLPFPVVNFAISPKGTMLVQREGYTTVHHLIPHYAAS